MEIMNCRLLQGPNLWSPFPVLEALIDVRGLRELPGEVNRLNERLTVWLAAITDRQNTLGERFTFVDLLRDGIFQVKCLRQIASELQWAAGVSHTFGHVGPTSIEGVYRLVLEFEEAALARACLESALNICLAAILGQEFDVPAEIRRLRELSDDARLGPSTRSIVDAAKRRGIPAFRLSEGNLVQLGHGARQRRIMAAETDRTSAVAETVAQDKELTRSLLRKIGVPVPMGRVPTSAAQAWHFACELGLPVVVKPRYGNHGRGVAANLTTRRQVVAAYEAIRREGEAVVIERFIEGDDYRLLIVGNRLVAAARREPPLVFGDGVRTVAQLVAAVNTDPRRAEGHAAPLTKIVIDAIAVEVLAEQWLSPDSVPAKDARVLIRRNGNLSTGGTATEVTAVVHPEVAARAVEAARMVGLDVAGIDILAKDIGRPLESQGGAVIEVNASPGLRMHLHPSHGKARAVGEAIVDLMFAPGETARIPIIAVTGDCEQSLTSRLIAQFLSETRGTVGLACDHGLFVNHRPISMDAEEGTEAATAMLLNPLVEAAVIQSEPATVLMRGLAFDRCDVVIIVQAAAGNMAAAELAFADEILGNGVAGNGVAKATGRGDLLAANRCLLATLAPQGATVLNADDPLVGELEEHCTGERVYFSCDERHLRLHVHRSSGGRAVFVRDRRVVAAAGGRETVLGPLDELCIVRGGRVAAQAESALAALAGCWALGVPLASLRLQPKSCALETSAACVLGLPEAREQSVAI